MENSDITIKFTPDEALVLSDWLAGRSLTRP